MFPCLVADVTDVGPLAAVEAEVGLEVGGVAEPLVAALPGAEVRPLPAVHQLVLLEVGELTEALGTLITPVTGQNM